MQLQVGAREGSLSHLTHLAERLRIRTPLLAGTDDDIHEAAVVLQPLLCQTGWRQQPSTVTQAGIIFSSAL